MTKFYLPEDDSTKNEIETLQAGGHLFCLNWQENPVNLYGYWKQTINAYSYIDIMIVPCGTVGDESCIHEKREVQDYLGSTWDMVFFYNQADFKINEYHEDRIQRNLVVEKHQVSVETA